MTHTTQPSSTPITAEGAATWTADEICNACRDAGLGILECHGLMVTLKAAPARESAPIEAGEQEPAYRFLVMASSETDYPEIVIAKTIAEVQRALVVLQFGDEDVSADERTQAIAGFDSDTELPWEITFEIGGIEVRKVFIANERRQPAALSSVTSAPDEFDTNLARQIVERNLGDRFRVNGVEYVISRATKPASTTSIADDAEFKRLLDTVIQARQSGSWSEHFPVLCAYIDASQRVAAPSGVQGKASDAEDAGPLAIACMINKKLGDYIAGRTYLLPDDLVALKRFHECATDFDSGGHDVSKAAMARLREIGVMQSIGFGRHQTTAFGDYVLERGEGEPAKLPLKTLAERNADAARAQQQALTPQKFVPGMNDIGGEE